MGLIDHGSMIGWSKGITSPGIVILWLPYLGVEYFGLLVLNQMVSVRRDPVSFSSFPVNRKLVKVTMFKCLWWQDNLPVSHCVEPLHHEFLLLFPFCKNSDNKNVICIWSPFPENPGIVVTVQPVIIMPHREITKCPIADQLLFL